MLTPPPRGGHFSVSLVCLVRDLVKDTGVALRGLADVLALLAQRWQLPFALPAASTIRSWLLRLGCYALCCPLPCDRPWVWLVDHTIQLGPQKLLVVLGCPLADVPFGRPLTLTDLRLVALVPMAQSTHVEVAAELKQAAARTGVPRLIVSDHGTDLKKGIADFQQRNPRTLAVQDVVHYGANVLENRWERQPRWAEFVRQLQHTNQRLRHTPEAYLLAPTLRPKARFMNVGSLLRFAGRVRRLLDRTPTNERVVAHYGWLRDYDDVLPGWLEEHRLVQATIEQVRRHGLNAGTLPALEQTWGELTSRPGTQMVAGHMRAYARKYGGQAAVGETLVGSTEVLESSFGKLKRLEGDAARGGFTGLVLALGALTGPADEPTVRQALDEVPKKEAESWLKRTLGTTITWLRRHILQEKEA